jgi:bla regulator protein blaR1
MTDWLYDTLLATSALLLLVLVIRAPVARHFGASVAYWLWLLPAARLFMPSLTQEIAASTPSADPIIIPLDSASSAAAVESAASGATSIDWLALGLVVWLGGATLLFIVQMVRYISLRDELLADATEIDRFGDIRVIQSDRIGGPLAFGLFRRYIAVPDHFTRSFVREERDLALAHELAHHRSGDLYANLAAFIVLCLFWFNPLAWMAWSAFRFDQEAACDARVLAGTDVETRQHYGRALARSATEPMPALAMAMALNRPRTIIERLRRVMMKDTSKGRLVTGRMAIFAAAAIALPLTATVVPVFAEEAPADEAKPTTVKHKTKVIVISGKGGKTQTFNVSDDADTPFVKTIEKDGKTIILRSNKEISEEELEKLLAEAETSREEAEDALNEAEGAKVEAMEAKVEAMAAQREAIATISTMDLSSFIPDIDIREIRGKCDPDDMTTDVTGFDGVNKSRIKIVMCGNGQAKKAKLEALQGLREARNEIAGEADMPENIRKSVIDGLDRQIERMKSNIDADQDGGDA